MGFAYIDSEHMTVRKGKTDLEISVFHVDSPANAYGLYSCLRDREGKQLDVADEASFAYGTAILWRGPYCIEIKDVSEEPAPDDQIISVCKTLSEALDGRHQRPELVRAFPEEKLNYRGLIYFHNRHPFDQIYYLGTEDILLLGNDATQKTGVEAVYADYELPKGPQGVLTLRYPKAEQAKKALDLYTKSVQDDLTSSEDTAPWRILTMKNGKQTVVFQKDRLLILSFETAQADAVRPVIEKIAKNLEPKKKEEKGG
jgi:hypothetical protein